MKYRHPLNRKKNYGSTSDKLPLPAPGRMREP